MINQRLQYSKEYILVEESQRAHLTAYIWAHYDQPLKQVVIESLFVHPSYRSNGVATRLKKEVEEWAKSVGAEQLVGTVRMDNHAMIELNTQLGYKKEKIVMAKRIEG
nr:GNAT family N-acetyltransferase [Staphylococcus canis]